jgi:hypothetical protein
MKVSVIYVSLFTIILTLVDFSVYIALFSFYFNKDLER